MRTDNNIKYLEILRRVRKNMKMVRVPADQIFEPLLWRIRLYDYGSFWRDSLFLHIVTLFYTGLNRRHRMTAPALIKLGGHSVTNLYSVLTVYRQYFSSFITIRHFVRQIDFWFMVCSFIPALWSQARASPWIPCKKPIRTTGLTGGPDWFQIICSLFRFSFRYRSVYSGSFIDMFSKLAPHPFEKTPIWAPSMEWVIRLLSAFTSST